MNLFKACTKCGKEWKTRDVFLNDPDTNIIGYQVNIRHLELGLFLFNHNSCQTTLSLAAKDFTDLYKGPVFNVRKMATDSCPEFCLNKNNLDACPVQCECSYVREVIQTVKSWQQPVRVKDGLD